MALRTLSLCSGVGGLDLGFDLGLTRLGFGGSRTVAYVEGEAFCASNLVGAMEAGVLDSAPIWSDIRTFDARPWCEVVDCVIGGYPCQPFSLAGKGLVEKDPRHLWPHVARIIGECRPGIVFLENVSSHLPRGGREVISELQNMDYCVAASLWTAEEIGAPHRRERLFILATYTDRFRCKGGGLYSSKWGPKSGNGGPELADADGERQLQQSGFFNEERTPTGSGWISESGVGRVAHGVASRMDRLRALGNGVVPEQAAAAFAELFDALTGRSRCPVRPEDLDALFGDA